MIKEFDVGYVCVYFKYFDDKSVGYLFMLMYLDGDLILGFDL